MRRALVALFPLTFALMCVPPASAAPTIISSPANGAPATGPFVFTFSEPMNTEFTTVTFIDSMMFTLLPTTQEWSGGNTILTCTPTPAFPENRLILWGASGENPNGDFLGEPSGGFFTTGSGSGGGGSGTNAITTFSIGKTHHYNQTSSGAPTLDPGTPYGVAGVTSLASNRTALNIQLTLPTGSVSNLLQLPLQPELWTMFGIETDLATFDAKFPSGNYSFFVQGTASNQTVIVNLPTTNSMPQPAAPHLTNYLAAQIVDPGQPFVLGWDAFPGGTAADYIDVHIGTEYRSPEPGQPGALTGTARTFTIPAGTLQPGSNYFSRVGFFRYVGSTNASQATAAFRATYTEFNLSTIGGTGGTLVLTNLQWTPTMFSFDVLCSVGQTVTVEYTFALNSGPWTKLMTMTNSPAAQFHVDSPQAASDPRLFYRARNGF